MRMILLTVAMCASIFCGCSSSSDRRTEGGGVVSTEPVAAPVPTAEERRFTGLTESVLRRKGVDAEIRAMCTVVSTRDPICKAYWTAGGTSMYAAVTFDRRGLAKNVEIRSLDNVIRDDHEPILPSPNAPSN